MDATGARRLFEQAVVARLATVGPDGHPHVVPLTFALHGDLLYFAVDAKPKRTADLKRLKNIASNASVAILVDHYEDDWRRLWWARLDGTARIVTDSAEAERAIDLLSTRYPQYRRDRPAGPVVAVSIDRLSGWSAS